MPATHGGKETAPMRRALPPVWLTLYHPPGGGSSARAGLK